MADLIPPDRTRCQCEKPNGYTFMTFGGTPKLVRCDSKPVVIVGETKPADDGLCGAMSLCKECFDKLKEQNGGTSNGYNVEVI